MRIALVAVNAKYIHTNLAVRSIAAYGKAQGQPLDFYEYTVNQPADLILRRLHGLDVDCILFSAYIWNIAVICPLAGELKKLRPDLLLGIGGPEVSYTGPSFLLEQPAFSFVLKGEGEEAVRLLAQADRETGWKGCGSLAYRENGVIYSNPPAAPLELDLLPFPYADLDRLSGRILYYESSRGCPFSCSYCLSSVETGVRCRSLSLVLEDLGRFLSRGVGQVKFIDRTFNFDRKRALDIWSYLMRNDNGVTNFHFELAGDLLDPPAMELLSAARPGLFQFEIGVQTVNGRALQAVRRSADLTRLFGHVDRLRGAGNIHLHLDLIAGLPFEDLRSFEVSFNAVYRRRPHQLQLGMLKVLRGSAMEASAVQYGLLYRDTPPYQVLSNRWISFEELSELEGIAHMVELYYNSGRFTHILAYLCGRFSSPYRFYLALWRHYRQTGCEESPPGKIGYYDLLGSFLLENGMEQEPCAQWLCRFDLLLHEKPRRFPSWVSVDGADNTKAASRAFYSRKENIDRWLPAYKGLEPKRISRITHLERFPFHPASGKRDPVYLLFDYGERDLAGHARCLSFSAVDPDSGKAAIDPA